MAGEDDLEIELDNLDTVQVAVGGENPDSAAQTAESKPKPRTRTARVSPDPVPSGPSPEEALAQAQAFAKQQEDARKAAEATAQAERERADRAEAARQTAIRQSEEHQERANNSELNLIESRIASAKGELEALEEAYTRAAEAGEFKEIAKLQTKMAKVAAALDRHEALKADLEANPRTPTTEGAITAPQTVSNPQEQHLAGYAPAAQSWLRQHLDCLPPQVGGNAEKHNKMMQGHYAALAKGYAANSDIYFKEIESHINPTASTQEPAAQVTSKAADTVAAGTEPRRAAPAPAAPVSRDAPSASGQTQNRTTVRLSKEQQEMAKLSFPHLKESEAYGQYARNLLELQEEGKIGRTTH